MNCQAWYCTELRISTRQLAEPQARATASCAHWFGKTRGLRLIPADLGARRRAWELQHCCLCIIPSSRRRHALAHVFNVAHQSLSQKEHGPDGTPLGRAQASEARLCPASTKQLLVHQLRQSPFAKMTSMNFVTFNQDHSHLGVGMMIAQVRVLAVLTLRTGTTKGYRIYTTDPFNKQSESREGDVSSLEMLFSTSLVALTLSPRVLRIQNTKVCMSRCPRES
jgi:hypothetical protein